MEAFVQITGYVGGDVNLRETATTYVADFRLASTPRVLRGGEWEDGPTTWITVKAFRQLARNIAGSVRRGDPVIVIGRLRTSSWERDGQTYERLELDAVTVGPDLRRGMSNFHKNPKPVRTEDEAPEAEIDPDDQIDPDDRVDPDDEVDPETGEIRAGDGGDLDTVVGRELDRELVAAQG